MTDVSQIAEDLSSLSRLTPFRVGRAYLGDGAADLCFALGVAGDDLLLDDLPRGAVPPPVGGVLTLPAARADILNLKGVPTRVTFRDGPSGLDIAVVADLPASWTFGTSFPDLTDFPFDLLTVSEATFVYASTAWTGFTAAAGRPPVDLARGLNFFAAFERRSIPLLDLIVPEDTPSSRLSGSFGPVRGRTLPEGTIRTPLVPTRGITLFGKALSVPELAVRVSQPEDGPFQKVELAVLATYNGTLPVAVTVPTSGNNFALSVGRQDHIPSVEDVIAALPYGERFTEQLPDDLRKVFASVGFDRFSIVADTKLTPLYAGFAISTLQPWHPVADGPFRDRIVLEDLSLQVDKYLTIASTQVGLRATAKFLPAIFQGAFEFTVSLTNWVVDRIGGAFYGVVALKTVVDGLTGGTFSCPESFEDVGFSDFGVEVDRSASSYTLWGSAYAALDMLNTQLLAHLTLRVTEGGGATTCVLTGVFLIADQDFAFEVDLGGARGTRILATWVPVDGGLTVEDVATAFGWDMPKLPDGFDLGLKGASFILSHPAGNAGQTSDSLAFIADTTTGQSLAIVSGVTAQPDQNGPANQSGQADSQRFFLFGLNIDISANLTELPIVGRDLPDPADLAIRNLRLLVTSHRLAITDIATVNADLAALSALIDHGPAPSSAWVLPIQALPAGFSFALDGLTLRFGSLDITASSPGQAGGPAPGPTTAPAVSPAPVAGAGAGETDTSAHPAIKWFDVQRQIGPIDLERIGVEVDRSAVTFGLSASMAIGPVGFSLQGLSIGSRLHSFEPSFDLSGMGVSFSQPTLQIFGGFLKVTPDQDPNSSYKIKFQYDGLLIIEAEQWGLAALGSYAQPVHGLPSLFVFVDVNAPLGGPPFLVVEGLMGGFGFNRALTMPSFDQVQSFPLLALGGPQTASAQDQAKQTLQTLESQHWIPPRQGEYWLAAGLKISSFEIVTAEVLLVAEFGNDLQFAVLGLAWMSLPQGMPPAETFVFVELQLEAVLKPSEGYFGAAASLTASSYVLTKDCHLTGGFAFDLWFGGDRAGQFVLTAGGYHPAFKPPSYYPAVARLGYNWQVSSAVTIKGGSYFAITPSCGMAGGSIEAIYQSGDVKAWFTAQADLLVTWNPLSFTARLDIDIGASVRVDLWICHVTKTVSVGATLDLWGPPLGGRVKVHVVVVTLTIGFGSDDARDENHQALTWSKFEALLPAPGDVCRIAAGGGLTRVLRKDTDTGAIIHDDQAPKKGQQTVEVWVVRAGSFRFTTQSVVPASALTYGADSDHGSASAGRHIDIRPMNQSRVLSVHNLQIFKGAETTPLDVTGWTLSPVTGNAAMTLWGPPLTDAGGRFVQGPSVPSADTVPDRLTGYSVRVPPAEAGATSGLVPMGKIGIIYVADALRPQNPLRVRPAANADYRPGASGTTVTDIARIATGEAAQNRDALYAVLASDGLYRGGNDSMRAMAAGAGDLFNQNPLAVGLQAA